MTETSINKSLWDFYNRMKDKNTAVCLKCNRTIKCAGGSTSGLHNHLKTQHQINIFKRQAIPQASTCEDSISSNFAHSSDTKITKYFKETVDNNLQAVIARLAARDCISFNRICTSYDLQQLLKHKGYKNIPKSPNTIKKIVLEYGYSIQTTLKKDLSVRVTQGEAFSLTFDEWTSIRNHRFMNVNVHAYDSLWNLGLIRIQGSMPAEKCVTILNSKLTEFGISLKNVAAMTTDGASVMKKVGRLTSINQQLCFAHGIQLAILKVVYKRVDIVEKEVSDESNNSNSDIDSIEDDSDYEETEYFEIINKNQHSSVQHPQIGPIIAKVRQVVLMFKRSPLKNDILQNHIKNDLNKELSVILDTKTRWNSLLMMLERFYAIKTSIRKTLIDIKSEISFSEPELQLLLTIITALLPIKTAVEALCRKDTNLYIADITLKFMLDELTNQNTAFSEELKEALIFRIKERRTVYSDVMFYLFEPKFTYGLEDYGIFNKTNKNIIAKKIVEELRKFGCKQLDIDEANEENSTEEIETSSNTQETETAALSFKEKLDLAIKKKTSMMDQPATISRTNTGLSNIVKREMAFFEEQHIKGQYLKMVFNYLLSVRPTSVESERAFSAAGIIATKFRSRLNDDVLNIMCFLRAHFAEQKDLEINSTKTNNK